MTDAIGWTALVLTQAFWVPNILRIVRTRDVQGHSVFAWLVMVAGLACWLLYFIARGDTVGAIANVSGVAGSGITLLCVLRWRRPNITNRVPALSDESVSSTSR